MAKTSIQMEVEIATLAINLLLNAGYSITVLDEDAEVYCVKSTDFDTIFNNLFWVDNGEVEGLTCELMFLRAHKGDKFSGQLMFVGGNGCDVLADNSVSLNDVLEPCLDLAEKLAMEY